LFTRAAIGKGFPVTYDGINYILKQNWDSYLGAFNSQYHKEVKQHDKLLPAASLPDSWPGEGKHAYDTKLFLFSRSTPGIHTFLLFLSGLYFLTLDFLG
jgi:hypothetical protein